MTVTVVGDVVALSGPPAVEDAETLAALLQGNPARAVDLTGCGPLHTAVLQVLLAFRPRLIDPAGDPFVRTWLVPLLSRS